MIFLFDFYPLSFSPKGERFLAPSPVGEGWEGGNLAQNIDYALQLLTCYHNYEELH
jgi:hypothetical protein